MTKHERLVEWTIRWEASAATERPALLAEFRREAPELVEEFQQVLVGVGEVDSLFEGQLEADAAGIEAGRYRRGRFHATGGIGLVYEAEDQELRRRVALKCLQQEFDCDPDARRRFVQEAEITSQLEHPGIVPIYGLGRDAQGRPYYAMRFIEGETLSQAIEKFHASGGLASRDEFRRLLRAFAVVCETVAYAHSRGIVHRDLKPGNIMLGPYGETLVLDWGLAKVLGCEESESRSDLDPRTSEVLRSVIGQAKGTWPYMSPEQARGEWNRVGPLSDIYSLGSTLYSLLCNRRAYEGSSIEIAEKVRVGRFVPPRAINLEVPQALDAICCKAMALKPAHRYRDARDLAKDLDHWLAGEPVSAWQEPFLTRVRRRLNRHRTLATSAAAAVLAMVIVLAVASGILAGKNRDLQIALDERDQALGERNARNQDLLLKTQSLVDSNRATRADFEHSERALSGILRLAGHRFLDYAARLNTQDGKKERIPTAIEHSIVTGVQKYYAEYVARNEGRPDLTLSVSLARIRHAELTAELRASSDEPWEQEPERIRSLLEPARDGIARILSANPHPADVQEAEYNLACADLLWGQILLVHERQGEARKALFDACRRFSSLCSKPEDGLPRFGVWDSPPSRLAQAVVAAEEIKLGDDDPESLFAPLSSPRDSRYMRWAQEADRALAGLRAQESDISALRSALQISLAADAIRLNQLDPAERYMQQHRLLSGATPHNRARFIHRDLMLLKLRFTKRVEDLESQAELAKVHAARLQSVREVVSQQEYLHAHKEAAIAYHILAESYLERGKKGEAETHYSASLEFAKRMTSEPQPEATWLRLPVAQACGATAMAVIVSRLEPTLATKALDLCMREVKVLEPVLGNLEWFQRDKKFLESLQSEQDSNIRLKKVQDYRNDLNKPRSKP